VAGRHVRYAILISLVCAIAAVGASASELSAGYAPELAQSELAGLKPSVYGDNDVRVSKSDNLSITPSVGETHTEAVHITISNGALAADVEASVSLVGPDVCDPRLYPEEGDAFTGPILTGSHESTRLDWVEAAMSPDEVRNVTRSYAVDCPVGGPYSLQIVVNASSAFNDPNVFNNQDENHPIANVTDDDEDADGVMGSDDNCPTIPNGDQGDGDADVLGNVCDPCPSSAHCDSDTIKDGPETRCGSDPAQSRWRPERLDWRFAGVDNDGDALVDEPLPPGVGGYDCDGDGYSGAAEDHVFGATGGRDQDACGNNGWPADLFSDGVSLNTITLQDVASFLAPVRRLDTSPGDAGYNVRWDLVPGSTGGKQINLVDVSSISTLKPPMLAGAKALSGPACPWPP